MRKRISIGIDPPRQPHQFQWDPRAHYHKMHTIFYSVCYLLQMLLAVTKSWTIRIILPAQKASSCHLILNDFNNFTGSCISFILGTCKKTRKKYKKEPRLCLKERVESGFLSESAHLWYMLTQCNVFFVFLLNRHSVKGGTAEVTQLRERSET